ncbi:pentatricopeptide repeat-containing protein At3g05340 [Malania oleifera]|uniref:pentatricopeptide repeat-containing protein At3g05340 n=1 Tax=Malania oleifera TaxID=397392 RepID=UPI0025ADF416|nr:pentatricopeptide repeat-containing protein At3g05340 [Malania oleifera]
MKFRWVFHKLKSPVPTWVFPLISPFRTLISQNPSSPSGRFFHNHVNISLLLSSCGRDKNLHLGSSLHASIIKSFEFHDLHSSDCVRNCLVVWNSLLSMYSKCGEFSNAAALFDDMLVKDTVSWNVMMSGFLKSGHIELGFGYFKQMHESGVYRLDQATLTTILSAFDSGDFCFVNEMMHGLAFLSGYEQEITVGNALITSYFKCGCFDSGKRVFSEMLEKNVITWTAVISGLAQNQFYADSLTMFVKMRCGLVSPNALTYLSSLMACSGLQALREGCQIHGLVWKLGLNSDLCIESALMDMYSKCGSVDDAWQIFESADELDAVSMTVILVGFAQNGLEEEAIQIFVKMVKAGLEIDPNVISAVLGVFGVDTSLVLGKQIHSMAIKSGFIANPFVSNGLINMYAKCGNLEESMKVFGQMPHRNSISWNSMIAACARHGEGSRALQLYEEMRVEGAEPTDVTFLSLLHACSHVGLVKKGMEFLESMTKIHGICPRTEHYACVVDMLGRAGLLKEARSFIEGLPEKPGILVWQALLGACSFHGDAEVGKYAADHLSTLAPESPAPYILMANIYSSRGRWKERARTIKRMKEMGLMKSTGESWIEIDKKVHKFVVGDQMHSEAEIIYGVLAQLFRVMSDEGYVLDKRFILYCLDEDVSYDKVTADCIP